MMGTLRKGNGVDRCTSTYQSHEGSQALETTQTGGGRPFAKYQCKVRFGFFAGEADKRILLLAA